MVHSPAKETCRQTDLRFSWNGSCPACSPHARSSQSARLKTASSRFNPHSDRVKLKLSGGTVLGGSTSHYENSDGNG